MKRYDLVKLINSEPYLQNNLYKDLHGIITDVFTISANVLFLNPQNTGDYAFVNIKLKGLLLCEEKLPDNMKELIENKIAEITTKSKSSFEDIPFHDFDHVELIVENPKYSKLGIHKGAKGYVMDSKAVQGYVEVDFSSIKNNGEYDGDCISVNIKDLKILKWFLVSFIAKTIFNIFLFL